MSVPAQKYRELVFQMLYSYAQGANADEEMLVLLSRELALTKKLVRKAQERVSDILRHLTQIDQLIAQCSHSYEFERIQTVEKNILRLGIYELFYDQSIPKKVAIAEAKRLAKKFSTKEAASFVHALLDAAYRSQVGEVVDQQELVRSAEEMEQMEQELRTLHKKRVRQTEEQSDE